MDRMVQPIKDYLFADQHKYLVQVDRRFDDLVRQFSRLQDARTEQRGAALVVYLEGQKVVDIYTGKKSVTENRQPDTISLCYSTAQGVLATLAHNLVS